MDSEALNAVQRHLEPGETIVWAGQPRQGFMFRGSDIFLIPFSLMWGGFAFFWEYMAITMRAPAFFIAWGIPFVAVGIYMIIGRFYVDARCREKTYYAVTNDRVVIISGLLWPTVRSLDLRTLSDVSLIEFRDGTGTVICGSLSPFGYWVDTWPGWEHRTSPRFDTIQDAAQVYRTIRDAQRNAK